MSKKLRLIFTLSLIANVLFVAVGAGLFWRFCKDDVPIAGDMSPEARHFVARTFQEGRERVKPLYENIRAQRPKVEEIITAEKFDKKAYDKEVDKMLDIRDKISRERADVMGQALSDLPQDDREKFAKRALDGLEGKRRGKGGYHHKFIKDGKDEGGPPPGDEKPKD